MQGGRHGYGDELGGAVGRTAPGYVFQAVYDEQAEYSCWQGVAEVAHEVRRRLFRGEYEERQEPCEHRRRRAGEDGDDLLIDWHISHNDAPPFPDDGAGCSVSALASAAAVSSSTDTAGMYCGARRWRVRMSTTRIVTIAGIMNESAPKSARQPPAATSPSRAVA